MQLTLTNIIRLVIGKGLKVEGSYINPCPVCGKTKTCHIEKRKGPKSLIKCSNGKCGLAHREHKITEILEEMKREKKLTDKEYKDVINRLIRITEFNKRPPARKKATKEDLEGKVIKNYIHNFTEALGDTYKPLVGYSLEMKKTTELFYSFITYEGNRMLFWKRDDKTPIMASSRLKFVLNEEGWAWRFRQADAFSFTKEDYLEYLRNKAETYNRFSSLPEVQRDEKTRYTRTAATQKNGNGSFRRLLRHFTVKRGEDGLKNEYRLAAGLLSPFIGRRFDGKKPLFAIIADSQSSGKSTVVMDSVKVIQDGELPLMLSGNEQTNEKALGSVLQFANRYSLFDNITSLKQQERVVITRCITDQNISSWIMHSSHGKVPNNKTYFATFNKWISVDDDLSERALIIRMDAKRNVTEEQRRAVEETLNSLTTDELLADIWSNLSKVSWKVDVPHIRHQKCDMWSRQMARVLHAFYPEVKEFDFARSVEDSELDEEIARIGELIDKMYHRYETKRGGEVVISCRRIWEEWKEQEPGDYFSGHQNALTAKIKSVSDRIRGYYVEEGRRIPCKERDPKVPLWRPQWTQQRCFVIRQKTIKTIEYDADDIRKLLLKWGIKKGKVDVVVNVLAKADVKPENYVDISKKILKKLDRLDEENLVTFIELFNVEERPVKPS